MRSRVTATLSIILLLSFCEIAWAVDPGDASCSPIDFADPNPQIPIEKRPLSVMPIFDQGKTDTCYAHVAAELVDAWRFSHGDQDYQHITDPLVIAAAASRGNFADNDKVRKPDGTVVEMHRGDPGNREGSYHFGKIGFAMNAVRANGSCPRSLIMDRLSSKDLKEGVNTHYSKLKALYTRYDRWVDLRSSVDQAKKDLLSMEWEPIRLEVRREAAREACTWMRDQYGIKPSQLPDLRWMESLIEQDNPVILFDEMLRAACKASGKVKKVSLPEFKAYETVNPSELGAKTPAEAARKLISTHLGLAHPQPIGLNVCVDIFENPNLNALLPDPNNPNAPYKYSEQPGNKCGVHSVLLAGRRRDPETGKCQLIIRNSWGPDGCKNQKWVKTVDGQNQWKCLHGDFLIDEDTVLRNTAQVSLLTDGKN